MREFILAWVEKNIPEASAMTDRAGNIYITKGESETYPCVVAHLDQVQKPYPSDYKVIETADMILAFSPSNHSQCGLGADDKCGIWIALKMLEKHDVMKVAFFIGEEVGCVGSSHADMEFFEDVRFVLQPDRRGYDDLITEIGGMKLCSDEFIQDINPALFGYGPTSGLMTDVEELKQRGLKVCCINLSCGYYNPHSEDEYVIKEDMINAMNFVDYIITKCTDTYLHETDYEDFSNNWWFHGWNKRYGVKPTESEMEELWFEQYEMAESTAINELRIDPSITFGEFYDTYREEFDMLSQLELKEIFKDSQEKLNIKPQKKIKAKNKNKRKNLFG